MRATSRPRSRCKGDKNRAYLVQVPPWWLLAAGVDFCELGMPQGPVPAGLEQPLRGQLARIDADSRWVLKDISQHEAIFKEKYAPSLVPLTSLVARLHIVVIEASSKLARGGQGRREAR
jgi:hypothetical protein